MKIRVKVHRTQSWADIVDQLHYNQNQYKMISHFSLTQVLFQDMVPIQNIAWESHKKKKKINHRFLFLQMLRELLWMVFPFCAETVMCSANHSFHKCLWHREPFMWTASSVCTQMALILAKNANNLVNILKKKNTFQFRISFHLRVPYQTCQIISCSGLSFCFCSSIHCFVFTA